MILDFLIVFHMVWKNQESCESWLVEFWVIRHSKMSTISVNTFFFAVLSCHYGFTNYFEILNFVFSNTIPKEFQPVKYQLLGLVFPEIIKLKACVFYFLSKFYFSLNHSPSKTMKNVFYFIWKAYFILELFRFLYFHLPLFFPCQSLH